MAIVEAFFDKIFQIFRIQSSILKFFFSVNHGYVLPLSMLSLPLHCELFALCGGILRLFVLVSWRREMCPLVLVCVPIEFRRRWRRRKFHCYNFRLIFIKQIEFVLFFFYCYNSYYFFIAIIPLIFLLLQFILFFIKQDEFALPRYG